MKEGLLVILSGPSGVGKGTVRSVLMKDKSLNLVYSISLTTRPPRIGEINGKDYFFTTKENFEKQLREDGLLEYAKFVNNRKCDSVHFAQPFFCRITPRTTHPRRRCDAGETRKTDYLE